MSHLLIAGAGFLGSEIATLSAPDHRVTTLTKSGGDDSLACDLSSPEALRSLAKTIESPDLIIHCASSGRGGVEAYRSVFLDGCVLLKETFPNAYLLLTSSTSVYHQTEGEEVTEQSPAEPNRETSRILLEAEELVDTVARLGGLYGPGRSVIYRKFMEGSAVIEDEGQRILNQIHVTDAARACLFLADGKHAGIFNVTDDSPLSQLACYRAMAKRFKKNLPPRGERNLDRKRAWTNKFVKNAKIRDLGWEPVFPSFLDALDSLAAAS